MVGEKSESSTALLVAPLELERSVHSFPPRREHHGCPALLLGVGDQALYAAREVIAARNGFAFIGIVADEDEPANPWLAGLPIVGTPEELDRVIARTGARAVVLAREEPAGPELDRHLASCRDVGTEVLDVTQLLERLAGRIPVSYVRPSWLADTLSSSAPGRGYFIARRGLDLVIASVALGFLLPLFPLLALAIWVSTGGSPLLVQERVGLFGRIIRIYKLRSMVSGAETPGSPVWAESDDQRVTRLGRLLRRTRLDEVPQFLNVLSGEMSVIGPRPERPYFAERLRREITHYDWRHVTAPGITGWAQVNQGYAASVEESFRKLELDLYYIKHRSLGLDLRILRKTIGVVLGRRGAR